MPNYCAKVIEKLPTKPGCWEHVRVGVFDGESQIGEYVRTYPGHADTTFCSFEQAGRWYALYSKDYTATRLMTLPDCTDIGGEEPSANGFCPVDYHVPLLCGQEITPDDPEPRVANHDADRWATKVERVDEGGKRYWRYYWPDDKNHPDPCEDRKAAYLAEYERSHELMREWRNRNPVVEKHAKWGFVYGCPWGAPYWIRFVDLSRVAEGVLTVDDRFGAIDLPPSVTRLKDAIDTDTVDDLNASPENTRIRISLPVTFTLAGKRRGEAGDGQKA